MTLEPEIGKSVLFELTPTSNPSGFVVTVCLQSFKLSSGVGKQ